MPALKISKELFEYRPYILAASSLVPLNKLKAIISKNSKNKNVDGLYDTSKKIIILYNINSYTKDALLYTLAHELAHLTHLEHTPHHFRLMSTILLCFSFVMTQYGVIRYADY